MHWQLQSRLLIGRGYRKRQFHAVARHLGHVTRSASRQHSTEELSKSGAWCVACDFSRGMLAAGARSRTFSPGLRSKRSRVRLRQILSWPKDNTVLVMSYLAQTHP